MRILTALAATMVAATLTTSCNTRRVYDRYANTPVAGWEKNDTLSFDIPPVKTAGPYTTRLGLRTSESYPFTSLTLIVEQHIYPSGTVKADTVRCQITDRRGNASGHGISFYQYRFDVGETMLQEGDSLHVTIRHDMKREILPGISDVGISLEKQH